MTIQAFSAIIPDVRDDKNKIYQSNEIVFIALVAVICGADTWNEIETFGTSYIVKVQLRLGFRVDQRLNVYLRQISTDLVKSGEIEIQSRNYTIMPDRRVGDFRFTIIVEQLSYEANLNFWDAFLYKTKLFIKRFTVSPTKWFGLETSDVDIENVPLFLGGYNNTTLKRVGK